MRRVLKFFGWLLGLVAVAGAALAAWLHFAPPDLIRVGAAYTAKIVCSNVFIAGRDPGEVLKVDVQAPGHPLLRIMQIDVDKHAGTVRAGLFGAFGKGLAVHRPGLGCTSVANGDEKQLLEQTLNKSEAIPSAGIWPQGPDVAPSQNPAIAKILDDPALQGPGMRAIVVAQNGRIIGERYGEGFKAETPLLGWSMTKTVNAAIVGTLVREGKLKPEQDGVLALWAGDSRGKITLANLLSMSPGLAFNEDYGDVTDVTRMLFLEGDMALFATEKPLEAKPGLKFNYSSGTSVLLSRIWQNAIGVELPRLSAIRALRPPGHDQRRVRNRPERHVCWLVLPLRHRPRLGPLWRIPAAGRRLERPADFACHVCEDDARAGGGFGHGLRPRIWPGPALAARAGSGNACRSGPGCGV